jgi:hypothetical protein
MKKIIIAFVALVLTLAFGVYKAHEYQAQKAWEEKVVQATANKSVLSDLIWETTSPLGLKVLAKKFSTMPDKEFECFVDSFLRDGYTGDFEEKSEEGATKNGRTLRISLRKDNPYVYNYSLYLNEPFFDHQQVVGRAIAEEISRRQSKAGKKVVH